MDSAQIADLLIPYVGEHQTTDSQLLQISTYIDILTKWNERMNLTAVRDPQQIVTRHIGESIFAALQLLDSGSTLSVFDVGSGAGFPGLPMKIIAPGIRLTLIEAQQKKATFLREAVRAMGLTGVEVFNGRAEQLGRKAGLVTMRAVEHFESMLPITASLVEEGCRMAILIGAPQLAVAQELLPGGWKPAIPIPSSVQRVLAVRKQ